ncbi:MAG: pyridoxal-phosphate dependent enzyme [Candidatus Cloacimonetes bacterium]|nr:pyridoxal-phosphate dependent enzyme [Candidatus Cloacimonadota bacterium]
MPKIITHTYPATIARNARRCKERGIILPTFVEMKDPNLIPQPIKDKLPAIGLWDVDPLNLFRINWKNDIDTGLFGKVNYLEIPAALSGVKARIIGLVGKYFPTGAHKVGAAYGCLAPRLVSGEFDPEIHKAVWPSTGNYCRGGAFDCALLDCPAVAILPEEMSQERFTWLREIGSEVIATPGCESNVKEIYDKCHELRRDPQYVILNQFDEFGNVLFHYHITGSAIAEVFEEICRVQMESAPADISRSLRLAAYISATGSAGTIAAGDHLKKHFPRMKTVATEAYECPTILMNGFGGHRIEGIGDKHIPWVHNVRNTDAVAAIRDEDCMRLLRLFNEDKGRDMLIGEGFSPALVQSLDLLGISSICNLLAAIKTAKYFEMNEDDVIFTVFTDSAEMYQSRLEELTVNHGEYDIMAAAKDKSAYLDAQSYDNFLELGYRDRKRVHNLKYYTWVEQQGKTYEELLRQWEPEYWDETFEHNVVEIDEAIRRFNAL